MVAAPPPTPAIAGIGNDIAEGGPRITNMPRRPAANVNTSAASSIRNAHRCVSSARSTFVSTSSNAVASIATRPGTAGLAVTISSGSSGPSWASTAWMPRCSRSRTRKRYSSCNSGSIADAVVQLEKRAPRTKDREPDKCGLGAGSGHAEQRGSGLPPGARRKLHVAVARARRVDHPDEVIDRALEEPLGDRMVAEAVPVPGELLEDPGEFLRAGRGVADQRLHGVAVEGRARSPPPGRLGSEHSEVLDSDLAIGRGKVCAIAPLDQVLDRLLELLVAKVARECLANALSFGVADDREGARRFLRSTTFPRAIDPRAGSSLRAMDPRAGSSL